MLKSDDNYDKVTVNALYHRLIWKEEGKMQGQLVLRDVCHKVLEGIFVTDIT